MRRKLYLHIGPMKTGTSTIQRVLKGHDNSIVIYPKVGLWPGGSHHNLVFNYFGNVPNWPGAVEANIDRLFEEIGNEARDSRLNLLISSEWLILGGRDVHAFAQSLAQFLDSSNIEVEIIVVFREHFDRGASLYNQRLKKPSERRDPDSFLVQQAEFLCHETMVRKLLALGYKVTGLNYHPAEGYVSRFLTHVGFPEDRIPVARDLNVSLAPKGLIARLALNRVDGIDCGSRIMEELTAIPLSRGPSQFIFGPQAVSEVEHRFARDRAFIQNQFGIELVQPPPELRFNKFQLDAAELAEIAAAVRSLGSRGDAVVEIASQYLRT